MEKYIVRVNGKEYEVNLIISGLIIILTFIISVVVGGKLYDPYFVDCFNLFYSSC